MKLVNESKLPSVHVLCFLNKGKKRPASRDESTGRDIGPPPKRHAPKQRDAASYLEKAIEDALVRMGR